MKLRPYQVTDVTNIEESWSRADRVLFQLSTGGGKTVIISQLIDDILDQEKKVLVLVHKERLLRQMVATLKSRGLWVGSIIRNEHINLDAMVVVASVSTVMRKNRIDLVKDRHFDYIVIDEAHHAVAESFTKVVDAANHGSPCKILGVTATPYRPDRNLKDHFDELVLSSKSMNDLIKDGFLSPYRIFYTPVTDIEAVAKSGQDYKLSELSKFMRNPKIVNYLVDSYEKLAKGRKQITFCVDVKHAKQVMEAYIVRGFDRIAYIDASVSPKEREAIFEGFQGDGIDIIVCIETLTEGVDLPECNCVQLARPTLSLILYLQMVGRGLRPKEDGGDCVILDNAGLTEAFGVPDAPKNWSLDKDVNPLIKSNKVLVRKRNGKITDDLEDGEFDELLEIDPDEFLLEKFGSIEEAEMFNKETEKKYIQSFEDMIYDILKKVGLSGAFIKKDWDAAYNVHIKEVKFVVSIENFKDNNILKASVVNSWGGTKDQNSVLDSLWAAKYVGQVNSFILENFETIKYNTNKLLSIKESKIDIHSLKNKIEEAKANLAEIKLAEELNKGVLEFVFPESKRPHGKDLKGKIEGWIEKITFEKPKLNKHNKVIVNTTYKAIWTNNGVYEGFVPVENLIKVFKDFNFNH